ncbi:MAG: hypothetical protein OJF49_002092 [Ktedonobacterales bacterium]|nr:MAG: hypothetical protein OJF49_002092 [Ktedonobacterales bacterium]
MLRYVENSTERILATDAVTDPRQIFRTNINDAATRSYTTYPTV